MKFIDEIDCLIKKYEESSCFVATNEYGKELQKIYKQIIFDLDYLKSDYCLMNHIDKIDKFERKLKKTRKEKKRWKKKYFKLYNDAIILKNTVDAFNVLYNPNSSSLERIEAGFGIEPIKNIK